MVENINKSIDEETLEQYNPNTKRRKRNTHLVIVVILLIGGVIAGGLYYIGSAPKSQFDLDRDALEGWLPGKSQEDIEEELNRIIDASRFNVTINPMAVVSKYKIANFMIENVPANNYWMQVSVYYQDMKGEEQLLYESKLIQQGYFIEKAEVTHLPNAGEYNGRAVFSAIIPESDEVMGQTVVTMMIYVEEE